MKQLSSFLVPLSVLSVFVTRSTVAQVQIPDEANNLKTTDTANFKLDVDLSISQATKLCQLVHDSRIQTNHVYLWVQVHSSHGQSKTEQKEWVTECSRLKYVACKGETRYPISDSCGFFIVVHDKECSSSGSGRSRRSTFKSDQKISLGHGQVAQLCASIQNLPAEIQIEQAVQYVPIRISLTGPQHVAHLSDECVSWTYGPCDKSKTETGLETRECLGWSLKISSTPKCTHYTDFYKKFNSSEITSYPNPMLHKTDFIMGENVDQESSIADTGMRFLSDVITCSSQKKLESSSAAVVCEISPKKENTKNGRSKRGAAKPKTPVARVKRACCGLYRCGRCGRARFGVRTTCECSNNDLCENTGMCDSVEYPSGCFGNCFLL